MRMELGFLIFAMLVITLRFLKREDLRETLFLISHLLLVYFVFLKANFIGASLLLIGVPVHYFLLRRNFPEVFLYGWPLAILIFLKSFPLSVVVGFSFLTFRMLSATLEVKSGKIRMGNLPQYLNYCFFFPTYFLGPIGTLRDHQDSDRIQKDLRWNELNWSQLLRVMWGAGKYLFISNYLRSFASSFGVGEWSDADSALKIVVIGFVSYAYVYLSFSGFMDIAVGLCHFLNFRMKENFAHPFRARNISDFWSNWHISLTDLLKELLFYPLSLHLLRRFGKEKKALTTPLVLLVLFLAIGTWHGVGGNFICLGLYHAAGAISAYFFGAAMSRRWDAYGSSKVVKMISIILTQVFIATSFLFFDNSLEEIANLWNRI